MGRKELSYEDVERYFKPREYEKRGKVSRLCELILKVAGGKMVLADGRAKIACD